MGNAYLTWAFAEAAVLCLWNDPAGQSLWPAEKNTWQGQGFDHLGATLARAVYDRLTRTTAFS